MSSSSNLVLITGGAGFIGSYVASKLLQDGYSIRILDNLAPQIHGAIPREIDWLEHPNVEFIRGSITVRGDIQRALEGVTHLIHLAAETGTGQSMYELARYNEVNSQGTALLFDVLANNKSHQVCRVVLSSSRSVYGEGAFICKICSPSKRLFPDVRSPQQLAAHCWDPKCESCGAPLTSVPTLETDQVRPASIYAATKFAQEDLVRVVCESLGIGFAILRLQNVYGAGQSLKNPYTGILSIFSTRIRRGLHLPVFEDGLETRDFVHVSDVANAMARCLASAEPANTVINVGSGVATSVLDVARQLSLSLGVEPNVTVTAEYRVGDIRHNYADISRLKQLLGYSPQIALEEGLKQFCDWVRTQPLPEDRLDQANAELRARKLMG
jgi:dTDP-L-rhamnose 4-epimerase